MAASLLGIIEEYLSSDVIQRASAFLGESPENTGKAVQSAVPAVLGGLIQRASTTEGAEGLLGLVTRAAQSAPAADPASLLGSGGSLQQAAQTGQSMLTTLFGGKLGPIADLIAGSSGIKTSSASSLLSLLTPLVLSLVGREAATRGGGAAGLMSLLASQKSEVMGFLPSGLTGLVSGLGALGGVSAALGSAPTLVTPKITDATRDASARIGAAASDVSTAASSAASNVGARIGAAGTAAGAAAGYAASQASGYAGAAADRVEDIAAPARTRGWLLPAVVIALLALGAWYFLRGGGAAPHDTTLPPESTPTASTLPAPTAPAAGTVEGAASSAAAAVGTAAGNAADSSKSGLDKAKSAVGNAAGVVADKSKTVAHEVASGAKTVATKTADVSKTVATKTADVSKDVARTTADATKTAAHKTADVSKDVAHKTADVTKEGARGTADVAKKVGSATKSGATKAAGAVAGVFGKMTGREKREAEKEAADKQAAAKQADGDASGAAAAAAAGETAPAADASAEATTSVKLPDGRSLQLAPGSASYQLAQYLQTTDPTGKTFVFERLQFHSGTTRLTSRSARTVRNLSAILNAYPSTEVRLDGYTDNTGKAEANQKLSQARADAVKTMLAKDGVSVTRLATAGYGAEKPIASNDSPAGRQQNRRIELVVTKR